MKYRILWSKLENTEINAKNYQEALAKAQQQEKTGIIFSTKEADRNAHYKLEIVCPIE